MLAENLLRFQTITNRNIVVMATCAVVMECLLIQRFVSCERKILGVEVEVSG